MIAHTIAHTMVSARGSLSVYVFMMFVGVSLSVHVGLGHTHGRVCGGQGKQAPPCRLGSRAAPPPHPAGVPVLRAPPRHSPGVAGPGQTSAPKLFCQLLPAGGPSRRPSYWCDGRNN